MIGFRHCHGRERVPATRSSLSQRVVLLAIIALASMSLGATSSLASASARADIVLQRDVAGAPVWKILPSRSGSTYTLAARGMPCATARPWVVKFTHQTAGATGKTFKGPSGFTCRSFSTSSSGDKLVYSGVCMKGPHNHPFFEWGPKV